MLRVGLTGSIAVGKSFVAEVLAELGCYVLDADDAAREVVAPGSPALADVVAAFGTEVLQPHGSLDRAKVAALIFEDEEKRLLLNSLLHPYIIARQDKLLQQWETENPDGVAIVDAALMIESGSYKRFDRLIVVHCRPEVQLERLMSRNHLTLDEAETRIRSQMSQEEKMKFADYLIDTSEGFETTRRQTAAVYDKLLDRVRVN